MEIIKCYNCEGSLPEKGYYCPNCAKQIKCKNCKDFLEKDPKACVTCGYNVDSINVGSALNKIEFHQKGNTRDLTASFTNEVGIYFSEMVNNVITGSQINPKNNLLNPGGHQQQFLKDKKMLAKNSSKSDKEDDAVEYAEEVDANEIDVLNTIFRLKDDKLEVIDNRLKHTSKRDFFIRLTLLFLYANELVNKNTVLRSALTEVLEQENANDPNSRHWIAHTDDLLIKDGIVELRPLGREKAKSIIKEISNPEILQKIIARNVKKKKNLTEDKYSESNTQKKVSLKSNSAKIGYTKAVNLLLNEGFFEEKRTISDIITHCSINMANTYASKDIGSLLPKLVRKKKLKRVKNDDGQFTYYQ